MTEGKLRSRITDVVNKFDIDMILGRAEAPHSVAIPKVWREALVSRILEAIAAHEADQRIPPLQCCGPSVEYFFEYADHYKGLTARCSGCGAHYLHSGQTDIGWTRALL